MDPVLQAFIGIVDENSGEHDNHPHRIAISLIDMFTGLLGFQAIATSLYARREQEVKQGRFIELSLMQGGAMLSVIRLIAHYLERGKAQRTSMPNGVFDTADGQIEHHHGAADRLAAVLRGDRTSRACWTIRASPRMRRAARTWTNCTTCCGRSSRPSRRRGWRNG